MVVVRFSVGSPWRPSSTSASAARAFGRWRATDGYPMHGAGAATGAHGSQRRQQRDIEPSVSEMVKYDMVDEFISHLGLKAFPGRKLRSMLLPLPPDAMVL